MLHTAKLIETIKQNVCNKTMGLAEVPMEDIVLAVETELEVYHNTFVQEQYQETIDKVQEIYQTYVILRDQNGITLQTMGLILDAMILALESISQAVCSLISGDYWRKIHALELEDADLQQVIDFVDRNKKIQLIPYDFVAEYEACACPVYEDGECGMYYVNHKGHRMYFPLGWSPEQIVSYYRSLQYEQDPRSPHCYQKAGFQVYPGDVVLDAGAAEGIFALDVLGIASHIYLVEAEESWVQALHKTFENDMDKVTIVPYYLSDDVSEQTVSIDAIVQGGTLNYIKMDIEGYEKEALLGGMMTIADAEDLRLAICSYHCHGDEDYIRNLLTRFGYEVTTSSGYMCPDYELCSVLDAEVRRGVTFGRIAKNGAEQKLPDAEKQIHAIKENYDVLVVITPKDFERTCWGYERLLDYLPARRICFIGSKEVGELVQKSGLGERATFYLEDDLLPFAAVNAVIGDILQTDQVPRGITGWYYQQFLKMQYSRVCRDEYYLVWDGDTLPCKAFSMFSPVNGAPMFDMKTEYHEEYFVTLQKLFPEMHKCLDKSFISEHMIMSVPHMRELLDEIELNAALSGSTFYEKILRAVNPEKLTDNSFSEFETFGTYMAFRHPEVYRLRNWHSFRNGGAFFDPKTISERDYQWLGRDFDAISFEKGDYVREDHQNLFDNPMYQSKMTARQMLEVAQEEFEAGYIEKWD